MPALNSLHFFVNRDAWTGLCQRTRTSLCKSIIIVIHHSECRPVVCSPLTFHLKRRRVEGRTNVCCRTWREDNSLGRLVETLMAFADSEAAVGDEERWGPYTGGHRKGIESADRAAEMEKALWQFHTWMLLPGAVFQRCWLSSRDQWRVAPHQRPLSADGSLRHQVQPLSGLESAIRKRTYIW